MIMNEVIGTHLTDAERVTSDAKLGRVERGDDGIL